MSDTGPPAWYVLHTRPRCEKKLEDYCRVYHLEHYLPLRKEVKVYQRRKVEVRKPLFPGYVFARFDCSQRVGVLRSRQVVRVLTVGDQAGFICEINQIRKALTIEPTLGACPALKRGARVRIVIGPFQGLEGVVSAFKGQTRVVLNVNLIGQGVPVEVTPDMLERL
ncbi:MAG: hypothetical protein KKG09_08795 [Verrucomicrobia bacterium]|nr:hypothetical protein [Verrucomicrobiota bacterium]MBU4246955.1 hypothetical protein [Verrucomicrobiota bacterium]MBU4291337.1 hypothetical protein [Verrucomicrobiota bacterium]MBU4498086.1 hypothetical protein [Verrucomicrobiota bacterium]MCG2680039.1 hypothetical protein [Kiritimatiellia bacterium]